MGGISIYSAHELLYLMAVQLEEIVEKRGIYTYLLSISNFAGTSGKSPLTFSGGHNISTKVTNQTLSWCMDGIPDNAT